VYFVFFSFHRPQMRRGDAFGGVCPSVCPVRIGTTTFESFDLETLFPVGPCSYIFKITRSSSYIKS